MEAGKEKGSLWVSKKAGYENQTVIGGACVHREVGPWVSHTYYRILTYTLFLQVVYNEVVCPASPQPAKIITSKQTYRQQQQQQQLGTFCKKPVAKKSFETAFIKILEMFF